MEFIGNVVTACPLANESGLLPFILRSSLVTRDIKPELLESEAGDPEPLDRGRGCAGWTYTSTLDLADVLSLAKEGHYHRCLGLVDGYPLRIYLIREEGEQEQTSFDINAGVVMPTWKAQVWEGGPGRGASFEYKFRVGTRASVYNERLIVGDNSPFWGYQNVFGKPWEEVVCAGSAYFPGGQLKVEVHFRKISKDEGNK